MKTKRRLLVVGAVGAAMWSVAAVRGQSTAPPPIDLRPMIVTRLTGTLHIQQDVPCAAVVDVTRRIIDGVLEIGPNGGLDVSDREKRFMLTRMSLFFAPFSVQHDCLGFRETRHFTEIGVQLGRVVNFTGVLADGRYAVRIPKNDVLLTMEMIDNRSSEVGYRHPSEDVTGVIDLARRAVRLHVVVGAEIHFKAPADCVERGCIVNEVKFGTLTADVTGRIVSPQPFSAADCKDGGWQRLSGADGASFTSQGECVRFVNTGR